MTGAERLGWVQKSPPPTHPFDSSLTWKVNLRLGGGNYFGSLQIFFLANSDLWPVTYFSRPYLAGIPIWRMSAHISHAFALFSCFQAVKHVIWCWSHALGWVSMAPEGQVRSLTFDDLGSLLRLLHVSRLVFLELSLNLATIKIFTK